MVKTAIMLVILLGATPAHSFAFNCAWGGGGGGYTGPGPGDGGGGVDGGGDGGGGGGDDDGGEPADLAIIDGEITCTAHCNNPKMVLSSGTR